MQCEQGGLARQSTVNRIGISMVSTVLFVQRALRVLHVTLCRLDDDPCSADGCKKWPWNGVERVKVAAVNDPANQIDGDGSHCCLYEGQAFKEHCRGDVGES